MLSSHRHSRHTEPQGRRQHALGSSDSEAEPEWRFLSAGDLTAWPESGSHAAGPCIAPCLLVKALPSTASSTMAGRQAGCDARALALLIDVLVNNSVL
jgi:hypothetical protein